MSKIVFIDVDGTLVDYDNLLPSSAVEAIRKARANGMATRYISAQAAAGQKSIRRYGI